MPARPDNNERPGWLGYSAAIAASALLHAAIVIFALFVMPNLLHSETAPPPTYTVKIVDNLPAGDLGTHLPKLAGHKKKAPPPPQQVAKAEVPKPEEPKVEPPKPPPPPPEPKEEDKNAVSLKTVEATPTPTPPPPPPEVAPTRTPTPAPTPKKIARPHPTPKPPPAKPKHEKKEQVHKNPKAKKTPVMVAKAEATPNIQEQLRKIREQLMKQHLAQKKNESEEYEDEGDDEGETEEGAKPGNSGSGGPVVGSANLEGKGYGVGPGIGSAGELQDLQFLLYYRQVQQKIKDAWTFPGGSNDLTATVDFSIGPDGNLTGVKIGQSSGDRAFDDSVVRAIRKAAPFPPPPDKYRSEFQSGVAAMFRLGELKS